GETDRVDHNLILAERGGGEKDECGESHAIPKCTRRAVLILRALVRPAGGNGGSRTGPRGTGKGNKVEGLCLGGDRWILESQGGGPSSNSACWQAAAPAMLPWLPRRIRASWSTRGSA